MRADGDLDVVADAELLDELTILKNVTILDVNQQAATFTNEHEQTAAGVVILRVLFEVLGEVADAFGQDRDLNLCTAGVLSVLAVFSNELLRAFFGDTIFVCHHSTFLDCGIGTESINGGAYQLSSKALFMQPLYCIDKYARKQAWFHASGGRRRVIERIHHRIIMIGANLARRSCGVS